MSLKSWFKFIYLGVVWGATFLWIKIGLEELTPLTFTALRLSVALTGLILLLLITRPRLPKLANGWDFLVLGVFNIALPFLLITWSEQHVTSGMAAILNSTAPLFTMLLAQIFVQDDRITLPKVLGLLAGFSGVVVLVSDELGKAMSGERWGQLGVLAASLSYAVAIIFARRRTFDLAPVVQALGQNFFANLTVWGLALGLEGGLRLPHLPMTWLAILWLGIMATCIGTVLYYGLLKEVGPTRTTLVTYLFPLVGVILGVVFLQEALSGRIILGGLLIISGVAIVNSPIQWRKSPAEAIRNE
ncbi:MAG: EamA family transporter [Chloroflexota bacterium]